MQQIRIIEFCGMAGSGKTFLATSLQPYLISEGLKATYLIHGQLMGSKLILFHIIKLYYSTYFIAIMPCTAIHIVCAILKSHPLKPKRLISVIINILYKIGFILYKKGTIILDEGIVHAAWSVYLFEQRFPNELCDVLFDIMSRCDINLNIINVTVESSSLLEQFVKRCSVSGGRHDLAPKGQVDQKTFADAIIKYRQIIERFEPIIDRTYELSNNTELTAHKLIAFARSII